MTENEVLKNIENGKYEGKYPRDFYEDLCSAFKLDPRSSGSAKTYGIAWQVGGEHGHLEVFYCIKDLISAGL